MTEVFEGRMKNTTGRGAAIGGTWGFLIGAAIGALYGLSEGSDSKSRSETDPIFATFGGVAVGALGWLVGMPIGAVKGTDDIYRLPLPPQGAQDRLLEGGSTKP